MITVEIYLFLAAVVAGAFVYMFIDLENRLYGNLFAAGFAALLSGLLALWSFNENTVALSPVLSESIETHHYLNDTLQNVTTANTHTAFASPVVDPTLGYFWMMVAVFMAFMFGYFIYEIMQESNAPGEEEF